jgi:hypothetical protein
VSATRQYPGLLRLLWETATGRRTAERSGPLLQTFIELPAPLRDAVRWVLRPKRRFLLGRLRALARDRVLSGPFAGMQLAGLPAAPELIGCYERELYAAVHALTARRFRLIINIGARYGYYAIGFARLIPGVPVRAFEGDAEARGILSTAVAANALADRVTVSGFCDTPDLSAALGAGDGVLVLCDIDGGEVPLLDPVKVPALTRATILVECHEPAGAPTEPVMAMRFHPTHEVTRMATEPRHAADVPAGVGEPWRSRMPGTFDALLQERRTSPQSWLLLVPRNDRR